MGECDGYLSDKLFNRATGLGILSVPLYQYYRANIPRVYPVDLTDKVSDEKKTMVMKKSQIVKNLS